MEPVLLLRGGEPIKHFFFMQQITSLAAALHPGPSAEDAPRIRRGVCGEFREPNGDEIAKMEAAA